LNEKHEELFTLALQKLEKQNELEKKNGPASSEPEPRSKPLENKAQDE